MTERKDMDTNLDAPATRRDVRELRDEMDERFREQNARIDGLEARLEARIDGLEARMGQRFREQDARIDARITKQFEVLTDALLDRIDRRMEERFAAMDRRMDERFAAMSQDFARALGISAEATRGELRIIDDQYKDLPGRVARLEDAVFKPAPRRAPRKRRSA
jgi:exonuclease VII large subunit